MHPQPPIHAHEESATAVLAKNLVTARVSAGITQHQLAEAADIARATIAQLEAGLGDPRLSMVTALAEALGVWPAVLLIGRQQVRSLAQLLSADPPEIDVSPSDRARMQALLESGLLKDRLRAGQIGAAAARRAGLAEDAVVRAGVFASRGVMLAAALAGSPSPAATAPRERQSAAS